MQVSGRFCTPQFAVNFYFRMCRIFFSCYELMCLIFDAFAHPYLFVIFVQQNWCWNAQRLTAAWLQALNLSIISRSWTTLSKTVKAPKHVMKTRWGHPMVGFSALNFDLKFKGNLDNLRKKTSKKKRKEHSGIYMQTVIWTMLFGVWVPLFRSTP